MAVNSVYSASLQTRVRNVCGMLAAIVTYGILVYFSIGFAVHIWQVYLTGSMDADWVSLLPNLNELWYPAFGMFIHWVGGFIILFVGLVQLFPVTRRYMLVHRALGTLYIVAALMVSLGGNMYIYTSSKHLVGGQNMDIAFSIYGWIVFVLAVATYYFARAHQVIKHRDFAIRLWGQGIASLCYRVWYHVVVACGYRDISQASDFHRPLDEFLDWWFFVPNLVVTECVVWLLHWRESRKRSAGSSPAEDDPLLGTPSHRATSDVGNYEGEGSHA